MSPSRRILLACFGSLGDLHPYIAVAKALRERGQRPVIAAMDRFETFITDAGIEYAPMRPTEVQMGGAAEVVQRLLDPWRGPEILIREIVMPHLRESYADLASAAEGAELIVSHPLTFAAPLVAEMRGLPWASTVLSPLSLMSAIDPPLFAQAPWLRSIRRLGVAPYRLAFGLVKQVAARWEAPLRAFRRELGLPPALKPALFEGQYSPLLNLALFPSLLAAPQADWPVNTHICGFARFDGPPLDSALQAELDAFLAAGEAPIVFTLGSSVALSPGNFFAMAVEVARRLKRRALLVTGTDLPVVTTDAGIKSFGYLPYSSVFPHALLNVHTGGIGTLSQALAAGRPQLVLPAAFDQPDNAERAVHLGVARSCALRRASSDTLVRLLSEMLANPDYARKAQEIAMESAQDGASRAAEHLIALR